MHHIKNTDTAIVGAGADVDEPFVVDRDVTGPPSFETVVFF